METTTLPTLKKLTKKTLLYGVICFIACLLSYKYADFTLVMMIDQWLPHESMYIQEISNFFFIFDPKIWLIFLCFLMFLIFINYKFFNTISSSAVILIISLFIAITITLIIKMLIGRCRPISFSEEGLCEFHWLIYDHSLNSFPSGHAAINFAGLLGLRKYFFYKKKIILLLCVLIAILVCVERILNLQHYFSDILGGTYIGIFSYIWGKALIKFLL